MATLDYHFGRKHQDTVDSTSSCKTMSLSEARAQFGARWNSHVHIAGDRNTAELIPAYFDPNGIGDYNYTSLTETEEIEKNAGTGAWTSVRGAERAEERHTGVVC